MAEGGEAEHYCSADRAHRPGCEYFFSGGEAVPASDLPEGSPNSPAPAGAAPQGTEVPPDDLPSPQQEAVPEEDMPGASTTSQLGAGVEGAAQGVIGPLAPIAENAISKLGIPELSYSAQAARKAEFPLTHATAEAGAMATSMMMGVGEARLAATLGAKASELASLGKVGATVVRNMVEAGVLQTGNQMSDYLQDPDKFAMSDAAKDVGATAVAGGVLGPILDAASGGLSAAKQALTQATDKSLARNLHLFNTGLGMASRGEDIGDWVQFLPKGERSIIAAGYTAYDKINQKIAGAGVEGAEAMILGHGNIPGYLLVRELLGKKLKGIVSQANEKYTMPIVVRALSSGDGQNAANAIRFGANLAKGAASVTEGVANVFKGGISPAIDYAVTQSERDRLNKSIEDGDMNSQIQAQSQSGAYAKGGEIPEPQPPVTAGSEGVMRYYPDQAAQIGMAKGRIAQYLNDLRPQPAHQLPYDVAPANAHHTKQYNKTLDLAIQPLTILNKVKDGSLTAGELGHFQNLYPELHDHLAKKLTEQVVKQQLAGEKPAYRTQQGLGLFLGSAVNSSQTQPHLAAAQAVFAQQNAAMAAQNPSKPKRKTAPLSKASENYQTGSQAAAARSRG
jgi:hypothetical protein